MGNRYPRGFCSERQEKDTLSPEEEKETLWLESNRGSTLIGWGGRSRIRNHASYRTLAEREAERTCIGGAKSEPIVVSLWAVVTSGLCFHNN